MIFKKTNNDYQEALRYFVASIEECGEDDKETIEIFLELIRKHLLWSYDFKYFNVKKGQENKKRNRNEMKFFYIFQQENMSSEEKNINKLCILSNIFEPSKLLKIKGKIYFDENENSDNFFYLKNMKIGKVLANGGHRTFKILVQNDVKINGHVKAFVRVVDDERILRCGYTDGNYLYFDNRKEPVYDYRFALLFDLTKLYLGYTTIKDLKEKTFKKNTI